MDLLSVRFRALVIEPYCANKACDIAVFIQDHADVIEDALHEYETRQTLKRISVVKNVQPKKIKSFQSRVRNVIGNSCEFLRDRVFLRQDFLRKAHKLAHALGGTRDEAHNLVDSVYSDAANEPRQDVGLVLVSLSILCSSRKIDMLRSAETLLRRLPSKSNKMHKRSSDA